MQTAAARAHVTLGLAVLLPVFAQAVVFDSTGDPSHNTTPPTGALADSGWQWQGTFNAFLGTAISPKHFVTAKHIGGTVGQSFLYGGQSYTTVAKFIDGASDLAVYEVSGFFSTWAALYTQGDEVGKGLIVMGRGRDRGADVVVSPPPNNVQGWLWGAANATQRWGSNAVVAVSDYSASGDDLLLRAEFNHGVGQDEAMLSTGDSGGGVFINDGGAWKLAGINFAVAPSTFSFSSDGSDPFSASMFDYGGLYYRQVSGSTTNWVYAANTATDKPVSFYATRVSQRIDWLNSVVPEPGVLPLALALLGTLRIVLTLRCRGVRYPLPDPDARP